MSIAIVTGAAGLVGSEAARHFGERGIDSVGLSNASRNVVRSPLSARGRAVSLGPPSSGVADLGYLDGSFGGARAPQSQSLQDQ